MAGSSEITSAVIGALATDATLLALMPNGVYFGVSPNGSTHHVIVSLVFADDSYVFEGRAVERVIYEIKAVEQNTSGVDADAAAARIDELIQGVTLTITGYTHMATQRLEYVAYPEIDDADANTRWQHRGGRYEVVVSPEGAGSPGSP